MAFCEIEPYCRAVLRKHWPDVPIFEDVTTLTGDDVGSVDVICGGFPCQDISVAGKQAGIDGERSGLWSECARLIGEIRPEYAIVENVAALLHNGLGRVLGDLAALGYDAEWHCIPASAVGAPHRRDRVWIVAYAQSAGLERWGCPITTRQTQRQLAGRAFRAGPSWPNAPQIPRVGYGLSDWVDRVRALGNAVVPAVVEVIGNAILKAQAD